MRFQGLKPQERNGHHGEEGASGGQRTHEAGTYRRAPFHPLEEDTASTEQTVRPAPPEWRRLAPFIEASKSQQTTHAYVSEFLGRLRGRLTREIEKRELVVEYMAQTFWRRWMLRAAAIAVIVGLAAAVLMQRQRTNQVREDMARLQEQVRVLQAGM